MSSAMAQHTHTPGTIGYLEQRAGITDRAAYWMQFAHIRGSVKVGGILRDASFEAGVAELRRRASGKEGV